METYSPTAARRCVDPCHRGRLGVCVSVRRCTRSSMVRWGQRAHRSLLWEEKPSQCHRSFPFSPKAKIKLLLRSVWCEELLWNEPPAAFSLNIAKIPQSISGLFEPNPRSKFPTLIRFLDFSAHVIEQKHRAAVSSRLCGCTLPPAPFLCQFPVCICRHAAPSYACRQPLTYYMKEQHSKSLL